MTIKVVVARNLYKRTHYTHAHAHTHLEPLSIVSLECIKVTLQSIHDSFLLPPRGFCLFDLCIQTMLLRVQVSHQFLGRVGEGCEERGVKGGV